MQNKKKLTYKALAVLLAVTVFLGTLPISMLEVEAVDTTYDSWSVAAAAAVEETDYEADTDGYVTEIYTGLGLAYFADQVNVSEKSYEGKTVDLMDDIDLNGVGVTDYGTGTDTNNWTSIGVYGATFKGTFKGNNKTISNIYIVSDSESPGKGVYMGLFGNIEGATIQDVIVKDINISIYSNSGGVVGIADGSTITNCHNIGGEITISEDNVGGIVGFAKNTQISYCSNTGTIAAIDDCSGGIVGKMWTDGNASCSITACYNTGTISGDQYVGGIVGNSQESCSIDSCYNTGTVTGRITIGGIAGYNGNKAPVTNCYNAGTISGTTSVGAIVGVTYNTNSTQNEIKNCYYNSDFYSGSGVSNSSNAVTIDKTTTELATSEVASSLGSYFSFKSETESGTGYYPYLTYFGESSAQVAYVQKQASTISIDSVTDWTYGTAPNSPTCTTTSDGKVTFQYYSDSLCETEVADISTADAGTYYVKATVAATDNYYTATSAAYSFCIDKAENTITNLTAADWEYGTTASIPSYDAVNKTGATVTYSTSENGEYTTVVPTAVGDYYLKITIPSSTNYNEANATTEVSITKVSANSIPFPTGLSVDYDSTKTLDDIAPIDYKVNGTVVGTFDWTDTTIVPTVSNSGYEMTFTPNEAYKGTYETVTKTVALTVNPLPMSATITFHQEYYTGYVQTPTAPVVTVDRVPVSNQEDYTIKYSYKDDGTYELTTMPTFTDVCDIWLYYEISRENYKTLTGAFYVKINPVGINESSKVKIDYEENQTYTGSAIEPKITVTYKYDIDSDEEAITLEEDTDYTLNYVRNTDINTSSSAGVAPTIEVVGMGNFKNTAFCKFTINPISADALTITDVDDQVYTGSEIKPEPVIKYGDTTLVEGTDYSLSYYDNTNVGEATIQVTYEGIYDGYSEINFDIVKVANEITNLSMEDWTYGEGAKKPTVTATYDADKATFAYCTEEDGTYTEEVPIDAGTYWVQATIKAGTNYKKATATTSFTIERKDIASTASIAAVTNQVYTGESLEPELVIKDGTISLVEGTDYTVDYSDNTNVGTANAKVTFTNNYTGTVSTTFDISKSENVITDLEIADWVYGETASTPTATLKFGTYADIIFTYSTEENGTYSADIPTEAGTYWLKAKVAKTDNYKAVNAKMEFEITAKDINDISDLEIIDLSAQIYTGSEIKPEFSVVIGEQELVEDQSYTVEYTDNIEVGTATVTIIGVGNYKGEISDTFSITKATFIDNTEDEQRVEYAGVPQSPTIDITAYGANAFKIKYYNEETGKYDLTEAPSFEDVGEYTVQYKVTADNHKNLTGTIAFGIYKSGNGYNQNFPDEFVYGTYQEDSSWFTPIFGEAKTWKYTTLASKDDMDDEDLYYNADYTDDIPEDVGYYAVKITVPGTSNYNKITCYNIFEITPKNINDIEIEDLVDQYYTGTRIEQDIVATYNGVTLVKDVDYTLQYSNAKNVSTENKIATVTIKGIGNYTGKLTKTFHILQAANEIEEWKIEDWTYGDDPNTPSATATFGNIDFQYSATESDGYSQAVPTEVGTYWVKAKVSETNNYKKAVEKFQFNILAKDVNSDDVIISKLDDVTYTGEAFTPALNITNGDKMLIKDTDYTVSYSNNTATGNATVTVTGINNYSGEITTTFEILKISQTIKIEEVADKTYGDESFELSVAGIKDSGIITYTVPEDNGVVTIKGNTITIIGAGTVVITVTTSGDDIYASASANYTLNVAEKPVTDSADDDEVTDTSDSNNIIVIIISMVLSALGILVITKKRLVN